MAPVFKRRKPAAARGTPPGTPSPATPTKTELKQAGDRGLEDLSGTGLPDTPQQPVQVLDSSPGPMPGYAKPEADCAEPLPSEATEQAEAQIDLEGEAGACAAELPDPTAEGCECTQAGEACAFETVTEMPEIIEIKEPPIPERVRVNHPKRPVYLRKTKPATGWQNLMQSGTETTVCLLSDPASLCECGELPGQRAKERCSCQFPIRPGKNYGDVQTIEIAATPVSVPAGTGRTQQPIHIRTAEQAVGRESPLRQKEEASVYVVSDPEAVKKYRSLSGRRPTPYTRSRTWNVKQEMKTKEQDALLDEMAARMQTLEERLQRLESLLKPVDPLPGRPADYEPEKEQKTQGRPISEEPADHRTAHPTPRPILLVREWK
ncbi:MAG: hypothetical protein ACOYU7_07205 [Bacillota bacterium]